MFVNNFVYTNPKYIMSFAKSFSKVTLSLDFDQMDRVNKLVGTKPTKNSVLIAKDRYTLQEVIVPQYKERKLNNTIKELANYGTPYAASKMVFPTTPSMVLREFRP